MAIRLAKDLKQAEQRERNSAFHVVFTEGQNYDLDELASLHDRTDSLSALVIEVKNEKQIANHVLEIMRAKISEEIETTLGTTEVQEKILDTVKAIFKKYKSLDMSNEYDIEYLISNNLPYEAYRELKDEINTYLRSIYNNTHIQYSIIVNRRQTTITYRFVSDEDLDFVFSEYYNEYAQAYNDELLAVEEGALAISDDNSEKLKARTGDFEKYLLDDSNQQSPKKPLNAADQLETGTYLTNKRPVILWEDGIEDTVNESMESDVYKAINELADTVNLHSAEINGKLAKFEFNEVEVGIGDGTDNDVSEIEGFDLIERHTILLSD